MGARVSCRNQDGALWWGDEISTAQANYDGTTPPEVGKRASSVIGFGRFDANPWVLIRFTATYVNSAKTL
jgi:hypothetical protein